jgi:hypothetical protein
MRLALALITLAVLIMAVGGAMVMRAGGISGGEYAMFLLALAMVCFFGSLPVVLGVLTRPRDGRRPGGEGDAVTIVHDHEPPDPPAHAAGGAPGAGSRG